MSDVMLRKSVQAKLALAAASEAIAGYMRSAAARARREQTGQDLVEYAGIIVLIAAIVIAIGVSGLGQSIGNTIKNDINSVLNGTGSSPGGH